MKKNLIKSLLVAVAMTGALTTNAQNVAYATEKVSISIADVIGIVDDANSPIDAATEAAAYNMGAVNFNYPTTESYKTDQTVSGNYFNVSASLPFQVNVRAAATDFKSLDAADVIPISVLNITGSAPTGITVTGIPLGGLTTTYQSFATGGTGAVMPISPSYTIPAAEAQANIFGKATGTYTVDVYYQVTAQ